MKNKKRYLFTSDFMYFVPLLIAAIVLFGQVYCWFDDPARFASIGSLHVGVLTLTASVLLAAVTEAHMFVIVNDVVFAYNPRIAVMQPFSEDSLRELIGKTGTIFGDAPLSRVSDSPRSYFLRIAFYTVVCFAVVMSVGELAEKHDAVHVDMHAAIWRTIDRVRQMKTGLRDLQDFIHPRAVGNAAMARQFCLDIGETKMAEWLSGELERRYAAMDARAGDKPRLVCRLRPDRAGNVTGCSCMNYDILWNLNGADRASVGVCVPEGWRTSVIRQTQSNGVIRVCGRPDRLTNRVTVTADLAGRVLEEVVDIPAPWLISPDFAFVSAWKDMEWQRKAAPPVDVKEVRGWKVHTQTWDYAGDNDPSAIDLRAVNTGYPNGAAYVRRWLYAPRALKLKLVVGTQFWSACNAVRVWLDGKVVAETVLRSGWVDGKPYSCDDKTYPIVLEPGWHDLTALTANRMFDHYFHIRILDAETGKEPSELRIGCGLAD